MLHPTLRLSLTATLLAAPLVACGDDGETTETTGSTSSTSSSTTEGSSSSEGSTSSTGAVTDATTSGGPGSTTDVSSTSTTDASSTSTTDPSTSTSEGSSSTSQGSSSTGMMGGLSWEQDVYPVVIGVNCGCHVPGSGGLKMTNPMDSYMNLVDVASSAVPAFKRVAPGDPGNSYLLAKVKGTAGMAPFNSLTPAQMPKFGAPLPQASQDLLEQWIMEGANP